MSRLPFELLLGLRYLRPRRTYVSIITLISIVGVMLGVAVLIIVISVMTGFDRQLKDKILGFYGHMKVLSGTAMTDYQAAMKTISANRHVKGVAPFILTVVLTQTQADQGKVQYMAPWLLGVDPRTESHVSVLPSSIKRGKFDLRGNSVVIGVELARQLNVEVGDPIAILSPVNLSKMRESQQKQTQEVDLPTDFIVKGIFDVGNFDYNANFVVTSLVNAQDLLEFGDQVSGLLVMLDNPSLANEVRKELQPRLGGRFSIRTWTEENAGILNALMVEKNLMFYILFFIVLVAAFGITSALITFAVQKTREIGMLKALGATGRQIILLFFSQSVFVGCVGVITGFGLGMLALSYRNEFLHLMNRWTGFELFPASIYYFTELPAMIVPSDIAIICGGSLLLCTLAGLIPAWHAGRLKPIEALRYE